MELFLNAEIAAGYKSPSQRVRVITEKWFEENMYCPACPSEILEAAPPSKKVIDFVCPRCDEKYQMKSMGHKFGTKVMNSAYYPKIEAIKKGTAPNYVFMHYERKDMKVYDVMVIPRYFMSEEIIEKRKPLSSNARRAGWIGSNILLERLPQDARIYMIKEGRIVPERDVREAWKRFSFFNEIPVSSKGWLTDIISCIRKLDKREFTLQEMYEFEDWLGKMHPQNKHIRPKIRQQLQILRDRGILEFIGRGRYRLKI